MRISLDTAAIMVLGFLGAALLIFAANASIRAQRAEAAVEDILSPKAAPNLAGYGCDGTHGTIYAAQEDHFPRCAAIVRVR